MFELEEGVDGSGVEGVVGLAVGPSKRDFVISRVLDIEVGWVESNSWLRLA